MKNHSPTLLQFSGYPLEVIPRKKQKTLSTVPVLSIVRARRQFYYYPSLQVSELVKQNQNWDAAWFGNYE